MKPRDIMSEKMLVKRLLDNVPCGMIVTMLPTRDPKNFDFTCTAETLCTACRLKTEAATALAQAQTELAGSRCIIDELKERCAELERDSARLKRIRAAYKKGIVQSSNGTGWIDMMLEIDREEEAALKEQR